MTAGEPEASGGRQLGHRPGSRVTVAGHGKGSERCGRRACRRCGAQSARLQSPGQSPARQAQPAAGQAGSRAGTNQTPWAPQRISRSKANMPMHRRAMKKPGQCSPLRKPPGSSPATGLPDAFRDRISRCRKSKRHCIETRCLAALAPRETAMGERSDDAKTLPVSPTVPAPDRAGVHRAAGADGVIPDPPAQGRLRLPARDGAGSPTSQRSGRAVIMRRSAESSHA